MNCKSEAQNKSNSIELELLWIAKGNIWYRSMTFRLE